MIDTHTHLYMPEYAVEGQSDGSMEGQCAAVDRAVAAGVGHMILPGVDRDSLAPMKRLHELRPDTTSLAIGLHPTEVKENWREELDYIMSLLRDTPDRFAGVGETGLDFYWDKAFESAQMQAFDAQLAEASRLGKPVIIHCREALPQALEVLSGHPGVEAVFHSFGGSTDDVERILSLGDFYFGINGIVTFKNSGLRDTLPAIPTDRLLTETDAPFLAPTPHRGKRNESSLMPLVAATMATALGTAPEHIDELTTANAKRLFRL